MKLINYKDGQPNSHADPFILEAEGKFYVYATGADGIRAYVADTLTGDYKYIGLVFKNEGSKEYWAPSVLNYNGKYYMYVSFVDENEEDVHQQTMHVAVSDSPSGPFVDAKPIIAPFSIDSHVVQNENGLFIFYSVNDYEAARAGTYIVVDKMKSPTEVMGAPVAVVRPTIDEEIFMRDRFRKGQHWHTLEGAFYFSEGDYHYVIYSGNCYQNEYYFLGYAAAKTAERDLTKIKFEKMPDSNTYAPLISKNEFEAGTGHNSVIKYNGEYYCIYHGRDIPPDPRLDGDTRTARICKLKLDGLKITAERYEDKL
ncbi:MAG: glycoside hydrolase family 43 protein [Clostridia bacterium]|nr:glycoside hydrolase family 43 protein [Clostridia bacterium]